MKDDLGNMSLMPRRQNRLPFNFWLLVAGLLLILAAKAKSEEAKLNIERRGADVVLYVSGGTTNVQYQIFTSPDNTVTSTNWYYWRRAYSVSFPPGYGEILVYDHTAPTNAAVSKPHRFFQIRGVLPD